ncbi:MAG: integrase family protein [Alphaproteobacteria bacterium]|nr:integrase family protein [Alphaproteobacteria bacterium]
MTDFTNTAINALQPGQRLKDDAVPGLEVRATARGKSFMLYYRTVLNTERRPKIGSWGILSIAQAREIARGMLAKVAAGQDPYGERTAARTEPTVDDLWDRCEREVYNRGKRWDREARNLYRRRIQPALGLMKVKAVGYEHLAKLHGDTVTAGFATEANRAMAVVGKMFKQAERWGWRSLNSNPSGHVERAREKKRKRFAKPTELAAIGPLLAEAANDPENLTGAAFLYLLLFSGARPSEIAEASPGQLERLVDDSGTVRGVLRLEEGKTGERTVFLPPQAMAVLDRLPANRDRLAGRRSVPRALWNAIKAKVGCGDLWIRDSRRTFATVGMSARLATKDEIGGLLGHASVQTTDIYAKLMEDPAHLAAAAVAGEMERLLAGGQVKPQQAQQNP